jgi:DNA-binding response OmpR family regulator
MFPKRKTLKFALGVKMESRHNDPGVGTEVLGGLVIDLNRREVRWSRKVIRLTKLDFDLLLRLAQRPLRAWSFHELLEEVWEEPYRSDHDLVRAAVRRLRHRLARTGAPVTIDSVYGFGFVLTVREDESS